MDAAHWEQLLIGVVEWLGPCEIRFVGGEPLDYEPLPLVVRFAHRLECHTSVVTTGVGLDVEKAKELIDRGLDELVVWMTSLDDDLNRAATGQPASVALDAIANLVTARVDRGTDTRLTVWVPEHDVPGDLESHVTAMGVGEVLATGPWSLDGVPTGSRSGRCPVASRRVELHPDGTMFACPFKAPIGTTDGSDLARVWQSGEAHFAAIGACGAGCSHPELVDRHG